MVGAFAWMRQSDSGALPAPTDRLEVLNKVAKVEEYDLVPAQADRTSAVTRLSERVGGVGRIAIEDADSVISGISGARPVPPAGTPMPGFSVALASGPVTPEARVDIRLAEAGSGGGAATTANWQGVGRPIRASRQVFFGTPANPKGVPFGVHPEPASGGTSKDSGITQFLPPKVDLVPSGAVNDESNPLFGGEAETSESYRSYVENAFRIPQGELALSTFSIDVDTASYANVRRMLGEGHLPPADAVRVEELLNYFPYAYAAPTGDDPFAVNLEVAGCPWSPTHRLVRVGIKGKDVARKERPASNLVFLLDVSGSMNQPNKLPLVKASMRMLLDELNERDKVSIVVYAGASGMALPPTSCEKKTTILEAIEKLVASGSTNGAAGIQLAYDTAIQAFIPGGVNRVVLCTDGDWNVGATSHADLLKLISEKAKSKVFLTALGFGMDNLKDDTLELLADKGNGNYGYIDSTREAHKVLVEQSSGTLMTIAKDVKLQVEFNPATVAAYRLVGYDNRLLEAKDFNDDTKDAGEIGAGHTVTAFYEIVPVGVELPVAPSPAPASVDPLKYQTPGAPGSIPAPAPPPGVPVAPGAPPVIVFPPLPAPTPAPIPPPAPIIISPSYTPATTSPELMTVKLRWKAPEGDVSTKKEFPLTDGGATFDKATSDFQFASAVAEFALLLKQSPYRGASNLDAVLEIAGSSLGADVGGWRTEFMDIVKKAKSLVPTK
jgi:Ca-activated chloride channel family protein